MPATRREEEMIVTRRVLADPDALGHRRVALREHLLRGHLPRVARRNLEERPLSELQHLPGVGAAECRLMRDSPP